MKSWKICTIDARQVGQRYSDAVQQRVEELQQQARSYLQRPRIANYKQALELYDRMLEFSDLDATQRRDIAQQRVETEAAYEQFRAQFGELLTARQLQQDEQDLIAVRKLINAGGKIGPDGDELEPYFDQLKESVQQKLLRVAREKVALADKQVSDGLGFLDSRLLAAAQSSLHEAMRLVRGEEITSDDTSPETRTAITGIRNLLQDVPELKAALAEYTQHHAAVTAQHDIIVRIKPQFDQADQYFRATKYAQAINELESLRAVAGEQFRSRMVDDLEHRVQQYWERDTLARADLLLEAAHMALSRGNNAQVEQQARALIALEPQLQTPALDERRQQARELLKQLREHKEPIDPVSTLHRVSFVKANLFDLDVDAIVNPTSSRLRFGGLISQDIRNRLGSTIFSQIVQEHPMGVPIGDAIVTRTDALSCHYIIHTPVHDDVHPVTPDTVAQGVIAALIKAESLEHIRTIAFPSIGTGSNDLNPFDVAPAVLQAVITYLEQHRALEQVIFALPEPGIYHAYTQAYQSLGGIFEQPQLPHHLTLSLSAHRVSVGQQVQLQVQVVPAPPDADSFELPSGLPEVFCFISADGMQIQEDEVQALPLHPVTNQITPVQFGLQARLPGQRRYTVELFVEHPDTGRLNIFKTEGQITVVPPRSSAPEPTIRPPLDIRIAPPWILRLHTTMPDGEAGLQHLSYHLTTRLPNLHLRDQPVGTVVLEPDDLTRIQALLQQTLSTTDGWHPHDARERLLALGTMLFDRLFPADSAADFRTYFWQAADQITSWLIMQDATNWLPWELVAPYRANDITPPRFLAERYHLSRWVADLGPGLYDEVPVGEIALAHYQHQEQSAIQHPSIRAWEQVLQTTATHQGVTEALQPETPMYALHLLRTVDPYAGRHLVPQRGGPDHPDTSTDIDRARLNLRRKRPVVTLSMLQNPLTPQLALAQDDQLPERVLPFLRAGASVVAGPWWPTSAMADLRFWSEFYDRLVGQRMSPGAAIWWARQAVQRALPEQPDWLAYTLCGNPLAQPYYPETSEGYTTLECLNPHDAHPDGTLQPGQAYYFRASIRSRPPVWYRERIVQTEALPDQVRALFLAPGLQDGPPGAVAMQPIGRTMCAATCCLTPATSGDYPLLVQLLAGDNDEHLKTLQLMLKVRDKPTGA